MSLRGILLLSVETVIDQGKSGASATSEFGLESENGDCLFLGLHLLGELLLDLRLGDVSQFGVEDVNSLNVKLRLAMQSERFGILTTCFLAKRGFLKYLRT